MLPFSRLPRCILRKHPVTKNPLTKLKLVKATRNLKIDWRWKTIRGQVHTRSCIMNFNRKLSGRILNLSTRDIKNRFVNRTLAPEETTAKHSSVSEQWWRKYELQEETALHITCKCGILEGYRPKSFGQKRISLKQMLLVYIRETKGTTCELDRVKQISKTIGSLTY